MVASLLWQPGLVAWLVTFAVHGTVLLGVAWLAATLGRRMPDPVRERLWKVAAVGALVTSALQCWLVGEPAVGHLTEVARAPAAALELPVSVVPASGPVSPAKPSLPETPLWPRLVLLVASLGAALELLRWAWGRRRLARLLARRRPITDPGLVALLRDAGCAARLSSCPGLASPIAFGVRHPEICVPEGLIERLGRGQVRAMLAHEHAHLTARDPLWLGVLSWLVRLFPWQPLLRVARSHFRELAEFRCDAAAVAAVGPRTTARCLVDVADWLARSRVRGKLEVVGMAVTGSLLRQRVDRILTRRTAVALGRHRFWLAPLLAGVLAAVTTVVPGARVATHAPGETTQALVDVLAELDSDCALLAREFTSLQRELHGVALDGDLLDALRDLGTRLNRLDARRIELRKRILDSLLAKESEPRRKR